MDPIVELLWELAPAVPKEMTVIVLCDRGLTSPKLWQQIRAQGWHPYMRYPKNVTFCAEGGRRLPRPSLRFPSRYCVDWPGNRLQRRRRKAPLHPAGGLVRRTGGAVDHPDRPSTGGGPDPVGMRCASGSSWASRRSRAWVGNGIRPGGPTRRAFRAIGWCCRWRRC